MPTYHAKSTHARSLRIGGLVLTQKFKPISRTQFERLSLRTDVHCIQRATAKETAAADAKRKADAKDAKARREALDPKTVERVSEAGKRAIEALADEGDSDADEDREPTAAESLAKWIADLPVDIKALSMSSLKQEIQDGADCLGLSYDSEATKQELLDKISAKLKGLEAAAAAQDGE